MARLGGGGLSRESGGKTAALQTQLFAALYFAEKIG